MRMLGARWLLPICVCASACATETPPELSDRENAATAALAAGLAKPVDNARPLLVEQGRPSVSVKAPPLRKATQDEVEELNETFRTEGSRDRVLRRIELASGENRERLVKYYNSVATKNLAPAENERAKAKLADTLARAQSK